MTTGGKADVIEFATLTEGGVDKCGVQYRSLGAVIDDGTFGAPTHIGDIAISDLVPFQRRADQLDADLVENAILRFFNRLGWNIFITHLRCVGRERLSNASCHFWFSSTLQKFRAVDAFASRCGTSSQISGRSDTYAPAPGAIADDQHIGLKVQLTPCFSANHLKLKISLNSLS